MLQVVCLKPRQGTAGADRVAGGDIGQTQHQRQPMDVVAGRDLEVRLPHRARHVEHAQHELGVLTRAIEVAGIGDRVADADAQPFQSGSPALHKRADETLH